MSVFTDFLLIMGAIVMFLFMVMGAVNWLSRGFWSTWLKVRMSRGKKWLVRVWTPTSNYYRPGIPDGEKVKYRDNNKQDRTLIIAEGTTYKSFGVDCIEVDETTNGVRVVEGEEKARPKQAIRVKGAFYVVPGFDAVTLDALITRAYELGRLAKANKEKIILFVVVVTLLLVALNLYFSYNALEAVKAISGGPVV